MATRYAVASGNWSDVATWDGGATIPQAADTVVANGFTVQINQDVTVVQVRTLASGGGASGGGFVLQDTRTLTAAVLSGTTTCVTFSAASPATAAVVGTVTGSAGTGSAYGVSCTSTGTLTITGAISSSGSSPGVFNASSGTINITGDCTAAANMAAVMNNSTGAVNIVGNLTGGSNSNGLGAQNNSSGILGLTGNATGGSGGAGLGNQSTGTVNIAGNAVASGAAGVINASSGAVNITGHLIPSGTAAGAYNSGSASGRITVFGNIQSHSSGHAGFGLGILTIDPSITLTHAYRVQNGGSIGAERTLYTGGPVLGHPDEEDVRDGTTFGSSSEFEGTLIVPDPAYVSLGVPTDDTVGTLAPSLTAADIRDAVGLESANLDSQLAGIHNKTTNLPASPAAVGSAMTLTSGERTAVANEVEAQIIDDSDTEKVLEAIVNKINAMTDLDALTLAAIAAAVRTELTTELARIDVAVSSRLATAGYTAPPTAAQNASQVRTELTTELGRIDAAVTTRAATGAAMTLTAGERTSIADAHLDRADGVETGITPRQLLRAAGAALAGVLSGADGTTITLKAINNAGTTRIVATVDSNGNRSAVTLTL
jgi:hypothetical protein